MENKKIKVLLIEDDRADQLAFERFVEQKGLSYDYKIAGSLEQAKVMIDPDQYDIFIADYDLGDGYIFEVIELMKNIPNIITTGAGGEDIAAEAMRKGVFDYLIKDVERNYLKVLPLIIDNAINHKKTTDHINMLSHAMKNIFDIVFITDNDDKIIFVNKSFCETYLYPEKEILGKSPELFQLDRNGKVVEAGTVKENKYSEEYYHFRKDESRFPVSVSRSDIIDEYNEKIATVWVGRDITERKRNEEGMKNLVNELQEALAQVKTLSGFIPICSACKKIRDDQGYWNQIEQYIRDHSDAEFSHGMCPDCLTEYYPELYGAGSKLENKFQEEKNE